MLYNSPEEDLGMKIIAELGKVEPDVMPNKHSLSPSSSSHK